MSSNSSGNKLEAFFAGKGFYIVLFLCAAVIGVSAWMMAVGNETMDKIDSKDVPLGVARVETIVVPPEKPAQEVMAPAEPEPEEAAVSAPAAEEPAEEVFAQEVQAQPPVEAVLWSWPVQGELDRVHQLEALAYDVTMGDWRTHDGIDISAALGTQVTAAHSGQVESVYNDDLYGLVMTVAHGDGSISLYANLESVNAEPGEWLERGQILGTVGSSALCEVGQTAHLHYALYVNGQSVDPLGFLPI